MLTAHNAGFFDYAESQCRALRVPDTAFSARASLAPAHVDQAAIDLMRSNYETIRNYQNTCLRIFLELLEDSHHWLMELLFFGVPTDLGLDFHRSLPSQLHHTPRFFRTDQATPDLVVEIQAPGSGWGESALIEAYLRGLSNDQAHSFGLASRFNDQLRTLFTSEPVITHLLDNSSSLGSNLYFIQATRAAPNPPRYVGFDKAISNTDCNFVRTHLFHGMLAENFGLHRLGRATERKLLYDYPPICIFEQKLLLALPFTEEFSSRFGDDIRSLLPYTSVLGPTRCTLPTGESISLEDLVALPRGRRDFFIKFAGIDPSRNWGSRAVFYAGDFTANRLARLLSEVRADYEGRRGSWILQSAVSRRARVDYHAQDSTDGTLDGYEKLSGFYGPLGLLGIATMHRRARKVHGQVDTVMGAVPL